MTQETYGLERRFARFRERARAARSEIAEPPSLHRRDARDGRLRRARDLAHALGGRTHEGPGGGVVTCDWALPMPLSRGRLATLPYGVPVDAPLVCLDTETTGLGTATGILPFLVGLGWWEGTHLVGRQLVLPDHADEPALLDAIAAAIPADAWLVSYNGRSFDWPLLVTRYRLHRRAPPPHRGHLDLLPVARGLWKHRLPDARLASVESGISGVRRTQDLPGALIPGRYLEFLRSGRGALLADVLAHNRQDVVSLALLLVELVDRLAAPEWRRRANPGDLHGLGRAYGRTARHHEALECYEAALDLVSETPLRGARTGVRLRDELLAERARCLARMGRRSDAVTTWRRLAELGGPLAALAHIQLAKYLEHVERDPAAALHAAGQAAALAERARWCGRPDLLVESDLRRRRLRLQRALWARSGDIRPSAVAPPAALAGGARPRLDRAPR